MLEKWKKAVDKGKRFVVFSTEFSNKFDSSLYILIVAKLNAYVLSLSALNLITNYLSQRQQRTEINYTYS